MTRKLITAPKRTVLVVDDTAYYRRNLRRALSDAGFEVVAEAVDGAEAVARYSQVQPDLVTMDIAMPHMDGIEATREIRRADPGACIVMCSSQREEAAFVAAIRAGAADFVVKPCAQEHLVDVVTRALARRRR